MDAIASDGRPVALIFRSPVFNPSEGFVQAQAAALKRYQPVVVGLRHHGDVIPALHDRVLLPGSAIERSRVVAGDFTPVLERLRRLRPKLVHAHFAPDGLRALPLARALGVPLVTSLRGYDVQLGTGALLLSGRLSWMAYAFGKRRLVRGGALFLAVSEALRAQAVARGFPAERTLTHYNGVDLARYRPAPAAARERMVLHVGRLVEKKGTSTLIRAFARAATTFPDARLVIVGEGPLRSRLEREAATSGCGERIRFAGHIPADQVRHMLGQAWLLAAPSMTARNGDGEGLPNAVVEAAASGLPVVATSHAGIPEAVIDGVTGLLVPEAAEDALAHALERLLADPDARAAMGSAGRRLAEDRFDAARQAARLEAL